MELLPFQVYPFPLIWKFILQLQNFEMRYTDLQQEALQTQDKNRQSLQELSAKEEETVVIKVELSALQEKYKIKCNEVSETKNRNVKLFCFGEIKHTQM